MKATRFRLHTLIHKFWVFVYLLDFVIRLLWRGITHDYSKFSTIEAHGFGECLPKLHASSYGEQDYQELLAQTQSILQHHYQRNRHHPEHFEHGYSEMNLIDVVEMLCDWRASVKKHKNGDIVKSITYCQERFGMSDDIIQIFLNTVK